MASLIMFHGLPLWAWVFERVPREGAGVDLEDWPRIDTDGHGSLSDEAFYLGS
jgi:hypothetical protein